MRPLGGGAGAARVALPGACLAPRPDALLDVELVDVDDDFEAVDVALISAFSRRAASASRLARLRAARRCFDSWRLSGTVANGRAAGAPVATWAPRCRMQRRHVIAQGPVTRGGSART